MDEPEKLPEWMFEKLQSMRPEDGKRFLELYAKAQELAGRGEAHEVADSALAKLYIRVEERASTLTVAIKEIVCCFVGKPSYEI